MTGAAELLERHKGFTALFCASDESATGALSYLHQVGVSIPGDVSVLGYDGLALTAFTAPPLTTIRIPWDDICASAVHSLVNERYGLKLPVKRSFAAEVVWRASVATIGRSRPKE
jgi:LacI family transcriptional regulator